MFEQNIRSLAKNLIENYNSIIDSLYKTAYSTNPEAFRLKDPANIKLYISKHSPYLGKRDSHYLYFIQDKGKQLDLEIIDLTDEKYYEDFFKYPSRVDFVLKQILKKELFEEGDLVYHFNISTYIDRLEGDPQLWQEYLERTDRTRYSEMLRLASKEGQIFLKHVNHPVSYYAKNAAKYHYSLLDLQAIIDKVDHEDFSYQMDQAIAAYDQSLYLPACATLGVCLETLCKLLLMKNGEKVKDSDATMLDRLGERLREKKIISYKFKSRIDVCYKVRNLSSHTSPGKVLQGDCHFLITTINELVDTYF
ncbi:hypothetical protein P9D79_00035 [Bacillus haynesii]|uniref:hypothetical protein n=1 Tax=Bacillus haynesii TaxID=1925021 RepID=UPI00227F339D|nr:hypothetical protein [Bacillus haynesii]MCY8144341.1 hypothetical protein [Bacillus haynesii]MEC1455363.1 hypothetical protein [Bacillus haynesii]MEC1571355.1 hypothetical protein [Bacillus haynesii]